LKVLIVFGKEQENALLTRYGVLFALQCLLLKEVQNVLIPIRKIYGVVSTKPFLRIYLKKHCQLTICHLYSLVKKNAGKFPFSISHYNQYIILINFNVKFINILV